MNKLLDRQYAKKITGLEIFSVGEHTDAMGRTDKFTADDIDLMVSSFEAGKPEVVPVKLGHTSDEHGAAMAEALGIPLLALRGEDGEGQAALGRVVNLRRVQNKLVADLEVPDALTPLVDEGFFSTVSAELMGNGDEWMLSGLALLGAERPAVKDLGGLKSAVVLTERVGARSFHEEISDMATTEKFTDEDLSMFESLMDRLRGKKKDGDGEDADDDKKKKKDNSEGGMLNTVLLGLGFKEDADDPTEEAITERVAALTLAESIVNSIRGPLELAADATAEAFMEAITGLGKAAEGKALREFRVGTEYTQMVASVKALTEGKLISGYREDTVKLNALPGTAQALAEQLLELEQKMGKAFADKTLADWVRHNTSNQTILASGGITGDEKVNDAEPHAFEVRMKAYAEKHEVTEQVALAELAKSDGAAFVQYEADKAAEYNAAHA